MKRLLPVIILAVGLLFQAPCLAAVAPPLAEALSSARVGEGNVITDGNGQPVYDAQGQALSVLDIETTQTRQTVASLASVMRVPVADLLGYSERLGMSLPMVFQGTQTQVVRSDGGVEHVFVFEVNGARYAFMADKTGPNCFGVRMAHVDASGMGRVMTAHGLNGNFTNPPWYLSEEAKRDYWVAWTQEQVFQPPVVLAHPLTGPSSLSPSAPRARIRVGDHRVLDNGQRAVLADTHDLLNRRRR